MSKVKICGVMCENDIIYLNKYLPDFAGFIFAESRRRLTPEAAYRLAEKLDGSVKRVGVFVNAAPEAVEAAAGTAGLDVVQLHGNESDEYIGRLRRRLKPKIEIWKVVRVKDANSLYDIGQYNSDRIVLDAFMEGSFGGAGKRFDWGLAEKYVSRECEKKQWCAMMREGTKGMEGTGCMGCAGSCGCMILAGGLEPDNIEEAIRTVKPFAVDVSSGVETDGKKDEVKIRDFIDRVRKIEIR